MLDLIIFSGEMFLWLRMSFNLQTVLSAVTYLVEGLALAKHSASNTEWSLNICAGRWNEGNENVGANDFIRKDMNKKETIDLRSPGLKHW